MPDVRIVRAVEDIDTTTSRKWAVVLPQLAARPVSRLEIDKESARHDAR